MNQCNNKMFARLKALKVSVRGGNFNYYQIMWYTSQPLEQKSQFTLTPRNTLKKIQNLQQEYRSCFLDFGNDATLFSLPFDINVKTVPGEFQLDITDLQCNKDLKNTF